MQVLPLRECTARECDVALNLYRIFIWLSHDIIIIEQFTSVEQHAGGLLAAE